jgi:hypothetical protein
MALTTVFLLCALAQAGESRVVASANQGVVALFYEDQWSISIEAHVLPWSNDVRAAPNGPIVSERVGELTLAYDKTEPAETVARRLATAHQQAGLPVEYDVRTVGGQVVLVPSRVRDASGTWVAATNPFDRVVQLPEGNMGLGQALSSLLSAASEGEAPPIKGPHPFDILASEVAVRVSGEPATVREHLTAILDQATTILGSKYYYRLAWTGEEKEAYLLNIGMVEVPGKRP